MPAVAKRKFKLSLYGTEAVFSELRKQIDELRNGRNTTTTMQLLNSALTSYDKPSHCEDTDTPDVDQTCSSQQAHNDLLLTTLPALQNLEHLIREHNSECKSNVEITLQNRNGCSGTYQLKCDKCNYNNTWNNSLSMPNGDDVINMRVTHGFIASGMLPIRFERFSQSTGIGIINNKKHQKYIAEYSEHVSAERKSSCEAALTSELNGGDAVDIITDARHSTRRNSKYTDVVCIGPSTHKVIDHIVVRREDDSCAQRHELIGTKRIYDNFDEKDVNVRRHGHDRNASINKYVRETRKETTNQNDTWHVSCSIGKEMKKVSSGAKCREGKTWSHQLNDKVVPVKTHVQYSMRNCNGDPTVLRQNMDTIVDHYQNDHANCSPDSRCKKDPKYIPSRLILTDQFAINLLQDTIRATDVYRHPQNYVHHMDTYFVESFNNVLNIFHDKRIGAFGDSHYNVRSNLAICHWNENVHQAKLEFNYRRNIWSRWVGCVFANSVWRPY